MKNLQHQAMCGSYTTVCSKVSDLYCSKQAEKYISSVRKETQMIATLFFNFCETSNSMVYDFYFPGKESSATNLLFWSIIIHHHLAHQLFSLNIFNHQLLLLDPFKRYTHNHYVHKLMVATLFKIIFCLINSKRDIKKVRNTLACRESS